MIRLRLFVLVSALVLGFCGVLFRAFQLQILPTENVAKLAHRQLSRKIEIVGRRGAILDRNGREMAVSVNTLSVFANPKLVTRPAAVAHALAPIVGSPESVIRARLEESSERKFIWLARQLTSHQMSLLAKVDLKTLVGVGVLPEYRREYPQGPLAAHVLGFSSIDGEGIEGIEKQFDMRLHGDKAFVELKRDALGRPIFSESEQIRLELNHGENIELTIDSNLQYTAEHALKEAIEKHGAQGGTAIVMNPRTGEVLALANDPGFDPNAPGASAPAHRRNRAITDPIEPGSVVKPFVVARALEDRVVRPDTVISGGGGTIKIGRKTIHEAEADHRFKTLSIADLIRVSSNVGTVNLQRMMGWERIEDTYRKLGFGSQLGIELGGESRGIFNSPGPKQELERATMSFGQGIALTSLQIASAYCTIANGGWRVRPHVVRSSELDAKPEATRVFSEATSAKMRTILEKVVEGEGTGTAARVESFTVAGKTGTAQKVDFRRGGYERGAFWASFVGFVPSKNPRFVIYVMLDEPIGAGHFGGISAAPVFAKIARTALQLVAPSPAPMARHASPVPQKIPAVRVPLPPKDTPLHASERVPDVTGLSLLQAMRVLQGAGSRVEFIGEGDRVAEQLPAPGGRWEETRKVHLKLR